MTETSNENKQEDFSKEIGLLLAEGYECLFSYRKSDGNTAFVTSCGPSMFIPAALCIVSDLTHFKGSKVEINPDSIGMIALNWQKENTENLVMAAVLNPEKKTISIGHIDISKDDLIDHLVEVCSSMAMMSTWNSGMSSKATKMIHIEGAKTLGLSKENDLIYKQIEDEYKKLTNGMHAHIYVFMDSGNLVTSFDNGNSDNLKAVARNMYILGLIPGDCDQLVPHVNIDLQNKMKELADQHIEKHKKEKMMIIMSAFDSETGSITTLKRGSLGEKAEGIVRKNFNDEAVLDEAGLSAAEPESAAESDG